MVLPESGGPGEGPAGAGLNRTASSSVPEEEPSDAERAFDAFMQERYAKLVATVRLIVRDHGTAEDVVQETFARAYVNWSKLYPEGNPGGWCHRVATNLAISWRRKMTRELKAVARLGRRAPMTTPPPEIHPELQAAVEGLPGRQRAAVALHYVLGLPVADAAEAMGVRPGTVKSLLFQARANLREQLGEDGPDA